jgi:uncharacterized integral membrane protein
MEGEPEPKTAAPAPPPAAPEAPAQPPPTPEPKTAAEAEPESGSPFRFWAKVAVLLFVVAYAIAFVVGNHRSISVDFVFATAHVSLIWSILLLLVVGFLGGVLAAHLYGHRRRNKRRKA